MDIKLEPTTLSNLADGELEGKFQARLQELSNLLAEPADFARNTEGELVAEITMTARFAQAPNGAIAVFVGADLKRPKRMLAVRGIYRRSGKFFTANEPQEQPLRGLKLQPLRGQALPDPDPKTTEGEE
jgi:hypothetical protein